MSERLESAVYGSQWYMPSWKASFNENINKRQISKSPPQPGVGHTVAWFFQNMLLIIYFSSLSFLCDWVSQP